MVQKAECNLFLRLDPLLRRERDPLLRLEREPLLRLKSRPGPARRSGSCRMVSARIVRIVTSLGFRINTMYPTRLIAFPLPDGTVESLPQPPRTGRVPRLLNLT
jgi:hypothetical protein